MRIAKWLKKYFVPHVHNDHKPHFLRHESILFLLLLIILVELAFLVQVFFVFDKTKFLAAVLPGVLTQLTNSERQKQEIQPLVENELLKRAAELKAQDMAEKGYFAHTSPDGKSPWYWLSLVGYNYASAGENLAVRFYDSEDVSNAWMNSPTHRANIVKREYTEIGIGVAKGVYQGESTIFVAQFFGKPTYVAPVKTTTPIEPAVVATNVTKSSPTVKPAPLPVVPKPKPTPAPTKPAEKVIPSTTPNPINTELTQNTGSESVSTVVLGEETVKNAGSSIRSFLEKALTSPSHSVGFVYGILASILIGAVLIVLFIRGEVRHPVVMVRGLALIAVIIMLLYVNVKVVSIETLVPSDNFNHSFIAS